jgi:hypothetical protein
MVIFSILMSSGMVLGLCTVVVDVGNLYVEREQLQSGAEAAAGAVAAACALGNCATTANVTTQTTRAQGLVNTNAKDGKTELLAICGNWGALPSCPAVTASLSTCLGTPVAGENYVEVRVRSQRVGGSALVAPIFASGLVGASYQGTAVTACTRFSGYGTAGAQAALWADATTDLGPFGTLAIRSSIVNVTGLIHSNANVNLQGSQITVPANSEYVTSFTVGGTAITAPTPKRVAVGTRPGTTTIASYRPGGSLATGANYHAIPASSCVGGLWNVAPTAIPTGVVYVPCGMYASGSGNVNAMIVAEGPVTFWGSAITVNPGGSLGVAILTASNATQAVLFGGSSIHIVGAVQAVNGGVVLASAQSQYDCGVVANQIEIDGSDTTVRASTTGVTCPPATRIRAKMTG